MDVRRKIGRVRGATILLLAAMAAAGEPAERAVPLVDLKAGPQAGDARWDAGTTDGGLLLRLDMGAKRVEGHNARHAVCSFQEPRDLSGFEGLRVRVQTDKPRSDAEVSVWLAEADGSWYYLKSAVPLADRDNEGVCHFEDFAPAERVAPGDEHDEDFILDLTSIGKLAIGVVNPMGVGEVSFKVTAIDLIGPDYAGPEPAAVTVTGLTLSINGQDKVPPGLFGSVADGLPRQYRPARQVSLPATADPNGRRSRPAESAAGAFADWPAVVRALGGESSDPNVRPAGGAGEPPCRADTTAMNGAYEVLAAHAAAKHRKWLSSFSAESNGLPKATEPAAPDAPAKAAASVQYRRMVYDLRDLVYCAGQSPDKLRTRAMARWRDAPDATRVCFGLLADLRGRLIETRSDDPRLWAVASVDGTDPQARAADFDGIQRLVVVLYNDHPCTQQVDLTIMAPEGTEFGPAGIEWTAIDRRSFAVDLPGQANVPIGKAGMTLKLSLEDHSAWKIVIPLSGKIAAKDEVRRKQFFSPDILRKVDRGQPFKTKIALDAAMLRAAQRAWLRLVVEDVAPGEAEASVGDVKLPLPRARTADNVNRIVELPMDPKVLKTANELSFAVRPGNHAGYRVDMASIMLETRSR